MLRHIFIKAVLPFIAFAFFLSESAFAFVSGWYVNPAEAGTGYFIERQGDTVFMAGFFYEAGGRASWAASRGKMTDDRNYSGALLSYRSGQTLTGAHANASSSSLGNVALDFDSETSVTLIPPTGSAATLQRFNIASGSSTLTHSGIFESGWWWNEAEPSRYFAIELQGQNIFVAGFMYDESGNPIWYSSTGRVTAEPADGPARVYAGTWSQYSGGTTLGGAFRPATLVSGNVGALRLQFDADTRARLTLPTGRIIDISRFPIDSAPWRFTPGVKQSLGAHAGELNREYYKVAQWGLLSGYSHEWHDAWEYNNAKQPGGVYVVKPDGIVVADLNGDGKQDVWVNWSAMPTNIARPPISPSVFLNDGVGGLRHAPDFWVGSAPARHFAYRPGAADFNGDGVVDIVSGAYGLQAKNSETGVVTSVSGPIPLMLSTADRKMRDASSQIAGQTESSAPAGFTWAHDLAVGDVTGDGCPDFYQAGMLFVNDCLGNFTVRQDLLPAEAQRTGPSVPTYVMSSAIGDLDGDGVADLVIAYADGASPPGWIFLSDRTGGIKSGRKIPLPSGVYGTNTKFNYIVLGDINGDGRIDIMLASTRANPYYQGRKVQILMNNGTTFNDETSTRIIGDSRDLADGEGQLLWMDLNGDGISDLFDASTTGAVNQMFINDGKGVLRAVDMSILPIVNHYHIAGRETWKGQRHGISTYYKLTPVVLNPGESASFLAEYETQPSRSPQLSGDAKESLYYLIQSVKPLAPSVAQFTGLWWNENESGWGMSFTQLGSTVFVAWYTYDTAGKPTWYVMSSCKLLGTACTGDIYKVTGGTALGVAWNGEGKLVAKVGVGTISFSGDNTASFNFSINGVSGTKQITRQVFATDTMQPTINYSALWWNPSESGWGIALTQQFATIFATIYTYDADGNPIWYVASNCPVVDSGCSGDLYQVNGGSSPTVEWNGASKAVTKVGTVSFIFANGSNGTMHYTLNGVSASKSISRQLY